MIIFKELCIEQVDCFWNLLNTLDIETSPGRPSRSDFVQFQFAELDKYEFGGIVKCIFTLHL